jgi:hypothetical protein
VLPASLGSYGLAAAAYLGILVLLVAGRVSRHWPLAVCALAVLGWAALGCWIAWTGRATPLIPPSTSPAPLPSSSWSPTPFAWSPARRRSRSGAPAPA